MDIVASALSGNFGPNAMKHAKRLSISGAAGGSRIDEESFIKLFDMCIDHAEDPKTAVEVHAQTGQFKNLGLATHFQQQNGFILGVPGLPSIAAKESNGTAGPPSEPFFDLHVQHEDDDLFSSLAVGSPLMVPMRMHGIDENSAELSGSASSSSSGSSTTSGSSKSRMNIAITASHFDFDFEHNNNNFDDFEYDFDTPNEGSTTDEESDGSRAHKILFVRPAELLANPAHIAGMFTPSASPPPPTTVTQVASVVSQQPKTKTVKNVVLNTSVAGDVVQKQQQHQQQRPRNIDTSYGLKSLTHSSSSSGMPSPALSAASSGRMSVSRKRKLDSPLASPHPDSMDSCAHGYKYRRNCATCTPSLFCEPHRQPRSRCKDCGEADGSLSADGAKEKKAGSGKKNASGSSNGNSAERGPDGRRKYKTKKIRNMEAAMKAAALAAEQEAQRLNDEAQQAAMQEQMQMQMELQFPPAYNEMIQSQTYLINDRDDDDNEDEDDQEDVDDEDDE